VSGWTKTSAERHGDDNRAKSDQNTRSARRKRGGRLGRVSTIS
jgi:hypothetical protein